jgi:hypothetical protein
VFDAREALFLVVAEEADTVLLRHLDEGNTAVVQAGC